MPDSSIAFSSDPGMWRFTEAVLRAIGLDDIAVESVQSLELRIAPEQPILVNLALHLNGSQADALGEIVRRKDDEGQPVLDSNGN